MQYQKLISNIPGAVFQLVVNEKGNYNIQYISEGIYDLTGLTREDFEGSFSNFLDVIYDKDLQKFTKSISKSVESVKSWNEEFRVVNKNTKRTVWINGRSNPKTTDSGEHIWYGFLLDITEEKEVKKNIGKLEQTLHEMNMLIEYAPYAIFLIYENGKILRANKAALKLFNHSEEKFLNSKIIDLYSPEDINKVRNHYERDIFISERENKIEARIIKKDGGLKTVEVVSTPLKIANNVLIQSFMSDITNRKKFEKNRELLLDQLFKSLDFKSKFLATMSHELRTPLNAIVGFTDLLLEKSYGNLNSRQEEFLNDVKSSSIDLLNMINQVLDISKIEAGQLNLKIKKFSIMNLINQIESTFKADLKEKKLNLIKKGFNNINRISADPIKLKQIIMNLLSNAIKYTLEGKIELKIREDNKNLLFIISDTGIGIDKKDYDLVFKEFRRGNSPFIKTRKGTGLGLPLTKRLVNLHGGKIWFKSSVGKGTKFFFTIPKKLEEYGM